MGGGPSQRERKCSVRFAGVGAHPVTEPEPTPRQHPMPRWFGRRFGRWFGRVDPGEQLRLLQHSARHLLIGAVVGVLAGFGSAGFLHLLTWATESREHHSWLVWLLPIGGLTVGSIYHFVGGESARGTNLVLDELHGDDLSVPVRMAPLVLFGATVTHLLGGSGGREGAAVQIAASLSSPLRRWLPDGERRVALVAAVAGGFGSVFGVPVAGAVFALEVQESGRQRYDGIVAALGASVIGDRVTRALGIHHRLPTPLAAMTLTPSVALRVIAAAIAFGFAALTFIELTHSIREGLARYVAFAPARLAVGGVGVLVLMVVLHTRAYLGLSLPLIDVALAGAAVVSTAFAWKLLFTALTIGSGFPGGEVTPLFCIGACLGSVLAGPLGMPRVTLAALGYVAVYAAASNTPIACTLLAVEVFGAAAIVPAAITCVVATQVSGQRSVYSRQRVSTPAGPPYVASTMEDADRLRRSRRK